MKRTFVKIITIVTLALIASTPILASQPGIDEAQNGKATKKASSQPQVEKSNPVQTGFLTGPNAGDALDIALNYINDNKATYGLAQADIADLVVTDRYTDNHNGVTHLYLRQRLNGIEIYSSNINVSVTADGRVVTVGDRFVPDLPGSENTTAPTRSARKAVEDAADHLNVKVTQSVQVKRTARGISQETVLSDGGISYDDIPAKLMYHPVKNGELRLVWDMVIRMTDSADWWNLRVDTETGEVLSKDNWTAHDTWHPVDETAHQSQQQIPKSPQAKTSLNHSEKSNGDLQGTGTYQVYELPLQDPHRGGRTIINNPADPVASPYGWHDRDGIPGAEYTTTQGNNVFAYQDEFNNNTWDNGFPDGGPGLNFIYPLDLSQHPHAYTDASVTNLFYLNNIIHDIFYHNGFDEANGNFQLKNYTGNGAGFDPVMAEAQDGGGLNNANFATPPDGQFPRMQMYLGGPDADGVLRDGSFDNHVVIHEYGHGISTRLVGGPANSGCLNGEEQGGEGWSDWFGNALVQADGTENPGGINVGMWLVGEMPDDAGVRPFPYSTDFNINPNTYDDIKDDVTFSIPHGVGTIWATMMWDMYWNLVKRDGFDSNLYTGTGGNNLALKLVVDGLKFTPCNPTFIDNRYGILMADLVNNPITPTPETGQPQSQNECLIWESFAKRGLGYSADDGGTSSRYDGTEAFDLPPQCRAENSFGLASKAQSPAVCTANNEDATYEVKVLSYLGFNDTVTLSAMVPPTGATIDFSPNGSAAPYTSTLNIGNSTNLISGSHVITITGTDSNNNTFTTTSHLMVASTTAPTVTLMAPMNGITMVAAIPAPNFEWDRASEAISYSIEIATDVDFNTIVYSNTVITLTNTPPNGTFAPNTTYYWRVQGLNPCGGGTYSKVYSFVTQSNADVLLVDDDGSFNLTAYDSGADHITALDTLGVAYDVWDTGPDGDIEPDSATLGNYTAVVWAGGDLQGVDPAGEAALATYLDGGGCFFVNGQDYLYAKGQPLTSFQQNYLGVTGVSHDVAHSTLTGAGVFDGLGPYNLILPSGYSGNWSDNITIIDTAEIAFTGNKNNGDNPGIAGVSYDTGTYKTTFWAFSLETIGGASNQANALLSVLQWCDSGIQAEFLDFSKTVSTDSSTASEGNAIVVPSGTDVTYFFKATNRGTYNYTHHTLVDSKLGTLLANAAVALDPGDSQLVTRTVNITQSTTTTATWTAVVTDTGKTVVSESSTDVHVIDMSLAYNQCVDFESGALPAEMVADVSTAGNITGRVAVTSTFPYRGDYALAIDTAPPGGAFTQQAAILSTNLAGQTDVELNFWVRNHGDETHDQDGIFISDDNGATYTLIYDLNKIADSYTHIQLDLAQFAADNELDLTDNFLIKFQSFDNFPLGGDGFSFDDICIQAPAPKLSTSWKSGPVEVVTGDVISHTIWISNTGSIAADDTTMVDTIPAGLTSAGDPTASSGTVSLNGNQVEWSGTVAVSETVKVTIPLNVISTTGTIITNTAMISHASLLDYQHVWFVTKVVDNQPKLKVDFNGFNSIQVVQMSDEVITNMVTLHNTGFAELTWQANDSSCSNPGDISWASLSTISGTLARDEMMELMLTTDSTNLARNTYIDNLCFSTNAPQSETNTELVLTVEDGFTVNFTKTVGTEANVCATTNNITVPADSMVYYCYEIENSSNFAYEMITITDQILGVYTSTKVITPTTNWMMIVSDTISATTISSSTLWVDSGPRSGLSAMAHAVATVAVDMSEPDIEIIMPMDGAIFTTTTGMATIPIVVTTANFVIPDDGHWHLWLDGADTGPVMSYSTTISRVIGTHTITAQLRSKDHTPLGPIDSVTITVMGENQIALKPNETVKHPFVDSNGLTVTIEADMGTVTETITLKYSEMMTPGQEIPADWMFAGRAFSIVAHRDGIALSSYNFAKPLSVTIYYNPDDLDGIDPMELGLYAWNGTEWSMEGITITEVVTAEHKIIATVAHLTDFMVAQAPTEVQNSYYLPMVIKQQ